MKEIRLGAGISYWVLFDQKQLAVPEWRPHLQFKWLREQKKYAFSQRSRMENRWIRDTLDGEWQAAYRYILRPRFLFQFGYMLRGERDKQGGLQFVASDEIIFEFERSFRGFSENRAYAGLWYTISGRTTLQLGYVWIFAATDTINNSDIVYFTLRNNFNF